MDNKIKLKGQMKLYIQWPAFMSLLLIAMNVWIYLIDFNAATIMSIVVAIYILIVVILYRYNKTILLQDLIEFSNQYGSAQNQLLKELDIPYIMILDDGKIIWSNDAFRNSISESGRKEKHLNKLIPDLNRSIFPQGHNQSKMLELTYEGKDYLVDLKRISISEHTEKFVEMGGQHEFITVSFKDVTDINQYMKEQVEERMISGLIYIDNYDEVMDSVEEAKQSMLMALVERKITQYIGSVHGIIKKLENDKFFIAIKYKNLMQIEEDKFSILEEVKKVKIGNERSVTLSIGLGIEAETYDQNYNYARVAIDLALARGGDQAICKSKNDIKYFGGKTEQTSKNTRVKARVKAEALREFIGGADQVMTMGHRIADVDSFGAAIGVYRIAQALDKRAYVVINEITSSVQPLYDAFLADPQYPNDMFLTSEQVEHYVTDNTMVVVVDTNKPSLCDCPELLKLSDNVAVFDHHRQDEHIIENAILSYIEPYASSTCEMVAEILQYIGDSVKIRNVEADSMYAGIIIDTNNFMNRTGVRTFEAAAYLRRHGADVTKVRKLFRDDLQSYRIKARAIHDTQIFMERYAFATCNPENVDNPTILGAQISNELLDISGIKGSFVFTQYKGTIYTSCRAIDEVNVQRIAENLGGGGHINVAGVQFTDSTIEEAMIQVKAMIKTMTDKGEL